jgi:hypothetical protein
MKNRDFLFIIPSFVFLVFLISAPQAAHAASFSFPTQIFPQVCNCPGSAPAWGCIMQTFQNIIQFVIAFAVVLITIFLAWAGFTYMTSGGNPGKHELANKRITNAVVGLLIVLCAYLLVDSILKVIYNPANPNFGPWNSILGGNPGPDCLRTVNPPALPSTSNPATTAPAASPTTPATGTCGASSGLNCAAAVAYLNNNVHTTTSSHRCLTEIQEALSAGGITLSCGAPPGHSGYAGYCNSSLQALNFTSLGSTDSSPQAGDILVIQDSGGKQIGHITMFTGNTWISDFIQSNGESPPGNPYSAGEGYNPQYWRP